MNLPRIVALVGACLGMLSAGRAFAQPDTTRPNTAQLQLANGSPLQARLLALGEDWNLTVATGEDTRRFGGHEWFSWGVFRPAVAGHHILLNDGSQLTGTVVSLTQTDVIVDNTLWGTVKIPQHSVVAIVLAPPQPWSARDRLWDRLLTPRRSATTQTPRSPRDLVVLNTGDDAHGRLILPPEAPPRLPFFLPDVTLRLDPLGEQVVISAKRIAAIRFAESKPATTMSYGVIGLRDGSRCHARQVRFEQQSLRLALVCGLELSTQARSLAESIQYLRSPPLGWRPLDADSPADQLHVPLFQRQVPARLRRSAADSRLRVAGAEYQHGIGVFGRGRVVYDVPAGAVEVVTQVAIDEQAGEGGSVLFRIYVENEDGEWTPGAQSPLMIGGMSPHNMAVDLHDAKRIALITDAADHGEVLDYANWLNLRWVRAMR